MKNIIIFCFTIILFTSFTFAQAPLAKINTEPVSPVSLTTLGLTTNSVSAGLPVFANKTYVYLSAKDVKNFQPVLTSVFNLIQKPSGSAATLEDLGIANWKGLKADVKGTYKIEVTITTANGTDMDTATVYAGDYVGVGNFDGVTGTFPSCMTCHTGQPKFDGIYSAWKNTDHANTFKEAVDNWTFLDASCFPCHTTGTDNNLAASNNGFDDVAASLGWVWVGPPASGKWGAFKTWYPSLVKFATIGCENCHGAGSNHTSFAQTGSEFKTIASYRAGVCVQCHAESQGVQYDNSTHSDIVFETTTGSNGNTNNLQDCARCHDGRVYMQFTEGLSGSDPNKVNVKTLTAANSIDVTCQTCHDPHGNGNEFYLRNSPVSSDTLANGYAYTLGGRGKLCMDCHKARRNNVTYIPTNVTSTWGPHHSVQADVFFGKNAAEFGTAYLTNSHQFAVQNSCVTCHMSPTTAEGDPNRNKVGGHSFKLGNSGNGFELTSACLPCHTISSFNDFIASSDYDGDGSTESIPNEVAGLLTSIRILLPPTGIDSVSWQDIQASGNIDIKKAYWNYQLISNDGSNGMHNSKFIFDVLVKTKTALAGAVPVEDENPTTPKQFELLQNYPNPFNPSTMIKFTLPFDSKVKIIVYSISGEVVKVLADGQFAAGEHQALFNTNNNNSIASGIYLYSITALSSDGKTNFTQTKKMVLLK
jgi:hypothetical protein